MVGYGQTNLVALPISANGFADALNRMRTLARERAVPIPDGSAHTAALDGDGLHAAAAGPRARRRESTGYRSASCTSASPRTSSGARARRKSPATRAAK